MSKRTRLPSARVFLAAILALVAATSPANEFPPPGWSINYSTNSFSLTRPDLPGIQISIIDDLRTDLPQAEKFERLKAFFAQRTQTPSLAEAETQNAFAGFSAHSKGPNVRAKLLAMGHWQEGGLQAALVLNRAVEDSIENGGIAQYETLDDEGYLAEKIHMVLVAFLMQRYEIGTHGLPPETVKQNLTPARYAAGIPQDRKPSHMLRLVPQKGSDSIASILYQDAPTLLLFGKGKADTLPRATATNAWDPSLFDPYKKDFFHGTDSPIAAMHWRWKDESKSKIEIRGDTEKARWRTYYTENDSPINSMRTADAYHPLPSPGPFDLSIAFNPETAAEIAAGTRPFSELDSREIIFLSNGHFAAGELHSETLPEGKSPGAVVGRYHFDGYNATFVLSSGKVVHGFAGWLPPQDIVENGKSIKGSRSGKPQELNECATININGWIYSTYCHSRPQ